MSACWLQPSQMQVRMCSFGDSCALFAFARRPLPLLPLLPLLLPLPLLLLLLLLLLPCLPDEWRAQQVQGSALLPTMLSLGTGRYMLSITQAWLPSA